MTNIVKRFIQRQNKKAQTYRTDCLRYRGVEYKQLTK